MAQLPHVFQERVKKFFPNHIADTILNSSALPKQVAFRVNTLKMTPNDVVADLTYKGFEVVGISQVKNGFIVVNQPFPLTDTSVYKQSAIYLQNVSSMIPAIVLDPKPNEIVCDLCAAPGSKTSQLAALMQNSGTIIANDRSRERKYKLNAVLKQQGVTNTTTAVFDGKQVWKIYPEYFDKMLVDAPCSLEGTFRFAEPKSYSTWSPKKVKQLSTLQRHLLRSAVSATKVGGEIVYSTCTLSIEENESVIDWVVKKCKGAIEVVPVNVALENSYPAFLSDSIRAFDTSIKHCLRLLPNEQMEGFFVAKMHKTASTL